MISKKYEKQTEKQEQKSLQIKKETVLLDTGMHEIVCGSERNDYLLHFTNLAYEDPRS